MINMNHLRSFYTCALHKSLTRAAEELHVSQPSMSQQLKAFEEEIGFELFYRNGRTLDLTAQGKILFSKSQAVFESLIGIEDFIEHRPEVSGQIILAISDEIERPFAAKITSELIKSPLFKEAHFQIVSVKKNQTESLSKRKSISTEKDQFDFLITHEKTNVSAQQSEFHFPVKLITKKQNIEISHAQQKNMKSLLLSLGQPLLLPSHQLQLRQELEEHLTLSELSVPVILESNILACLTEGIREGLGCGFLPIQYVYEDIKKSKLSIFGPAQGFWTHKIYLEGSQDSNPSVFNEIKRIIQRFTVEKAG